MADFTIYLANKNYSSWSMRAGLAAAMTGAEYDEVIVPLDQADTRERILQYSPSAKLPALKHGDIRIWDSLAIGEYLAELFPNKLLWPDDRANRARARTVCAEMHSGFQNLRQKLPMNVRAKRNGPDIIDSALRADIERIVAIWKVCRARFGEGGDFLFSHPTVADAFYAPVVSRFVTYGIELDDVCTAYRDTVWNWEPVVAWRKAANDEPWLIDEYED